MPSIQEVLNVFQIANLFLQSAAILIGGWWTYTVFIRQRTTQPTLDVSHSISHIPLTHDKYLLRVTLVMENKGKVLFAPSIVDVWIQQVTRCPPTVLDSVAQYKKSESCGTAIEWPKIAERHAENKVICKPLREDREDLCVTQIEPGETDECHFDFLLDNNIESVFVFSYLECDRGRFGFLNRQRGTLGWHKTSLYMFQKSNTTLSTKLLAFQTKRGTSNG